MSTQNHSRLYSQGILQKRGMSAARNRNQFNNVNRPQSSQFDMLSNGIKSNAMANRNSFAIIPDGRDMLSS